jgi:hypothetical protein
MTDRKTNPVAPSKVKMGDMMAFTYYVKVRSVHQNGDELVVEDLDNKNTPISIRGKDLVERAFSADQYSEEEKVGKTRAAEILVSSHNRPLTVSFMKQDGTERVLKGRLVKPEPLLGRSMVEDLEKMDSKDRVRQVDHRTLNFLIVDGVKYVVKK